MELRRILSLLTLLCAVSLPAAAQEVSFEVPGADEDLTDRLRSNSLVVQELGGADPEEEPSTPQDVVAAARADYARLVAALYDAGYFSPVVRITIDGREAARLSPFDVPSRIGRVAILVQTGPRYSFGAAEIGPLASGTELPEEFRPGGDASTPVLRDTARAAIEGWRERGHATAEIADQSITARHPGATLDASIQVAPGPVVTFGQLVPQGQERMRTERILEIAGLPQGVVYSPAIMDRVTERLRDTGVFSAVALQEQPLGPDDSMNIVATLSESAPRRFGFGAEISSDSGAQVSAFWLHRNLFGGAERLRIEGEIGGIGQGEISTDEIDGIDAGLHLRFSRPATFTPDTTAYFEAAVVGLDEPSFRLVGIGFEAGVDHWFSPRLEGSLGIGLRANRFENALGTRNTTLLYLPGELTWDNRDDPLQPTSGVYMIGTAAPFAVAGDGIGARLTADARGYLGLGEADSTVLAARAQFGTLPGGEIQSIPPDYLFFSGGSDTVRGQSYQSLGAIQQGAPSGGRSFATLSGEVRQMIGDSNFGLVAFADAGYVGRNADFSDGDWHAGAGIGLRYDTPFGPIRVDIATPVRGGGVGDDLFLYIGIGQAF
ncbi:BamA/TamA family outer membrane protein [Roseibacterium sp. SDUM158016]|uniref:autotransporter assembly complex protein TamA n=1 Tax=Roseicyclus sediminis TaxID=2980997 RepID=UPI0021CE3EAA|nr:BamA/TamA family outer membrane protein [Roseibacterium sp. SDUM158016]MCU4652245.1 BamA/TamA family outer membrane protein [Roseibacterium sp. SDUM158016]